MQEEEIWKDIKGYEGRYQVSTLGRIKSLYYHNAKGVRRDGILKPSIDGKGYMRCALCRDNVLRTFKVHRLVAIHFVPNPNNHPQVNHINGIKQDNRVENLEWCDNSTNQRHAYANGLNPHHIGRKRKVLITTVSGDSLVFQTIREAAKHIGVNEETVRNRIKKPIQSSNQHKFVPFLAKDIQ